ncbi:MAG: hypothetical protein ACR2PS_01535 [Pseudomonadales bacterium]
MGDSQSDNYQNLIIDKGEMIIDGKTHWKDFVQVYIDDHHRAFGVAMDILRQIEAHQYKDSPPAVTFSLTGTLEPE